MCWNPVLSCAVWYRDRFFDYFVLSLFCFGESRGLKPRSLEIDVELDVGLDIKIEIYSKVAGSVAAGRLR